MEKLGNMQDQVVILAKKNRNIRSKIHITGNEDFL